MVIRTADIWNLLKIPIHGSDHLLSGHLRVDKTLDPIIFVIIVDGFKRKVKDDFQSIPMSNLSGLLGKRAEGQDRDGERFSYVCDLSDSAQAVTHIVDDDGDFIFRFDDRDFFSFFLLFQTRKKEDDLLFFFSF